MVVFEQRAVVAVAQEHHRLPVDLVGEEGRPREGRVLPGDRGGVERGVAPRLDELPDQPQEGARGERVGRLEGKSTGGALRQRNIPRMVTAGTVVEPTLSWADERIRT